MRTKYGTENDSPLDSLVMKRPTVESIQPKGKKKKRDCGVVLDWNVTSVPGLKLHSSYQYEACKYLIISEDTSPVTFALL